MRSFGYACTGVIGVALLGATATPACADLIMNFVNENTQYSPSNVYVTFGGSNSSFAGTINGGGPLVRGQSYSLTDLAAGVTIQNDPSGRLYISLGAPITTATAANGYDPNFDNSTLPDYATRWDKVEMDFTASTQSGGANLSAQDFFGVPLKISTSGGGTTPDTLTWNAPTATVMEALAKLSGFSVISPSNPGGAVATGSGGVSIPGVGAPVVRIVSPASVAGGSTVYPSLQPYLTHIESAGITTTIAGSNATAADPRQSYSFTATIARTAGTIGGAPVSPGDLVLTGTVTNGSGAPITTTVTIAAADLTNQNVYGANAPFKIWTGADTNGVVTKAVADYLAAINLGLIGSSEANPNDKGVTIGNSPSWTWYGNNPNGSLTAKLPITDAFAAAQPSNPYYNQYASYLATVTGAYGFAYNDRLQSPLASLGNGTTMTVTILPDGSIYRVTQSADNGTGAIVGSLSWAIDQANQYPGSVVQIDLPSGSALPVTLLGTPAVGSTTTWILTSGALSVGSDASFGPSNSALVLDGGTLEVTGTTFTSTPRSLTLGGDGGGFDIADALNIFTLQQDLSGSGYLIKYGPGTLVLNGNNTYTGGTIVTDGTLEVGDAAHPSALLAGNVAVDDGAMLRGHGTIGGTVLNAGTVQPGASIGVLTINGNYVQSSAGTLNIEITPSAVPGTGYDQLQVHGAANLAGRLAVLIDPGTYAIGTRYNVLHAPGGVTGQFGAIGYNQDLAPYITPTVTYAPTDVFLTLDPTPALSGTLPIFRGGEQAADMQTAILGTAAGVADSVLTGGCNVPKEANSVSENGCVVRPLGNGAHSEAWLRGLGGVGNLYGSATSSSFTDNYGGVLVGYGLGFDHFVVGLGAGYISTGLNFSDASSASENTGVGLLYARYTATRFRFGAAAAYGSGTVNGERMIPGTGLAASSSRSGTFGLFALRTAYDVPVGAYTIEPRGSFAYIHADQGDFTENGAGLFDLSYGGLNTNQSSGRLSVRLSRELAVQDWHLVPWVEAGVQETFSGLSRTANVAVGPFAGTVAGISAAPTAGTAGLGIRFAATKNIDGFLRYQGLFAGNETASAFSAGFRYRF